MFEEAIAQSFGGMGINQVQRGKVVIQCIPSNSEKELVGHGDTIKIGDIFYTHLIDQNNKVWPETGPFRLDFVRINGETNSFIPGMRYTETNGSKPMCDIGGNGWVRKFRLADKETTEKVNFVLQFEGMYVRLYFDFHNGVGPRYVLISAVWIAWVGDLMKAFITANTPYGKFKKKNIVRWIKTGLFTDSTMKSKIPVPDNFPVKLTI